MRKSYRQRKAADARNAAIRYYGGWSTVAMFGAFVALVGYVGASGVDASHPYAYIAYLTGGLFGVCGGGFVAMALYAIGYGYEK